MDPQITDFLLAPVTSACTTGMGDPSLINPFSDVFLRVRTYTVGQQDIGYFPMAIFQAVGPVTIRFSLGSGQGGARTLVIATTSAFAGGRPTVKVNNWSSSTPPAPNEPDSRGVTRGERSSYPCIFSHLT